MNKYVIAGFMLFFILSSAQVEALPTYSEIFDSFYEGYVNFFSFGNKITGYQVGNNFGGDGVVGGTCTGFDNDGDGFCIPRDCNDDNPAINPNAVEVCDDGFDNNCNDYVDCADDDCDEEVGMNGVACEPSGETLCADEDDNDGDGKVDCADDDCDGEVGGTNGELCEHGTETTCTDSFDNDRDGKVDCDDPDCINDPSCLSGGNDEICTDGLDNDGDGNVDCADDDCDGEVGGTNGELCEFDEELTCDDWFDNDGDGNVTTGNYTDCGDPDCAGELFVYYWDYNNVSAGNTTYTCCQNDNDCSSPSLNYGDVFCNLENNRCDENNCNNTDSSGTPIDDDLDYFANCPDWACSEHEECEQYYNVTDGENTCASGYCCSDGLDNDMDNLFDCWDNDCDDDLYCSSGSTSDPEDDTFECNNGFDDDGDGDVDCDDFGCSWLTSCGGSGSPGGGTPNYETDCGDDIDNDQDNVTDCYDTDCKYSTYCKEEADDDDFQTPGVISTDEFSESTRSLKSIMRSLERVGRDSDKLANIYKNEKNVPEYNKVKALQVRIDSLTFDIENYINNVESYSEEDATDKLTELKNNIHSIVEEMKKTIISSEE